MTKTAKFVKQSGGKRRGGGTRRVGGTRRIGGKRTVGGKRAVGGTRTAKGGNAGAAAVPVVLFLSQKALQHSMKRHHGKGIRGLSYVSDIFNRRI